MPSTTASWQHCRKAKEGDSQVGKEFWRQDESLKDLRRTLSPCFTTWHDLFWGMHGRSEISPVTSCLVHDEKLSPFYMSHELKYIGQWNFFVTFIQWKYDGWLWKGGCNGLDSEVYIFIDSCQLEAAVGSNDLFGSVDALLRFIHAQLACLNLQCWFPCMHVHNQSFCCLYVVCTSYSSIFVIHSFCFCCCFWIKTA
jgi:hypothetical protein